MIKVLPEHLKGDLRAASLIQGMYDGYQTMVTSNHALAKAVHDFHVLTKLELDVISDAFSKGIQGQLSRSYVSKLCRAGFALSVTPLAYEISDIEKIAELGRNTAEVINEMLNSDKGIVKLNGSPVVFLNRAEFKASIEGHVGGGTPKAQKPMSFQAVKTSLENMIKRTEDMELRTALDQALIVANKRIDAQKQQPKGTIKAPKK
jgi:hypothetical protein